MPRSVSWPRKSKPRRATPSAWDDETVEDDRLRLIFTCCHPALTPDAQVALTLREVCGLTTEEIAHAFLTTPSTVAQRIVRAKAKIRDARIPYQVPARADIPARLDTVLHVVYLVFNEGYSASSGESLTRHDLSGEAHSAGASARGAAAGGRSHRPARADAAARIAPRRAHDGVRRAGAARRSGPLALESRADRRGLRARRAGADRPPVRSVHAAGGDCRRACRSPDGRRHRLGADRRLVRRAAARRSVAGRRVESRRGDGDARWSRGRPGDRRCDSRPRRSRRLPPRAFGAGRSVPSAGTNRPTRARRTTRALALTRQEPERRFLEKRLRDLLS